MCVGGVCKCFAKVNRTNNSSKEVSMTALSVSRRLLMLSYMVECVTTTSDLDADVVVVF